MKNIKFAIPIYTDMQTIFDIATSDDKEKLDVVGHVIAEIEQGDPVWDDIVEQLTDRFGEGIEKYLDMANLEEFIEWDGTFVVKYDEMPTTEPDVLVYIVDCTFNVGKISAYIKEKIVIQTREAKITSWSALKKMAMSGTLKDMLKSGDVLPLTLSNGDKVDLVVGYDSSGRAYFIFDKAMSDGHVINKKWTNIGYAESEMARYADEDVFPMLPANLQHIIEPTKIVQGLNENCRETEHKLFCLSFSQVFGYDEHFDEEYLDEEKESKGGQIDIFKNLLARVKMRCDEETTSWWWLRSINDDYNYFYLVCGDGSYGYTDMTEPGAVVLGFCIEPDQ